MIYLNNASTTYPKPEIVINNVVKYLNTAPLNFGRSGLTIGDKNIINDTRELVKQFFNADDNYNSVFTSGSTESLNLVIKGIDLSGKNVVITATEHNSVIRPLKYLESIGKLESITIVPCDTTGFVIPDDVKSVIKENTELVCINHISNVTGTVQDLLTISEIVSRTNAKLLVDGSQSSGVIDISFDILKPDFFCYTGHKSLYGIQGTGGLLFKKSHNLNTFKHGGTGTKSYLTNQPDDFPEKYESGTMNIPGIIALKSGINYINEIGLSTIHKRKKEISDYIYNELIKMNEVEIYYNNLHSSGSIVSFNLKNTTSEEVNYIFTNSFDISIRSGLHCAPLIHKYLGTEKFGTLRVSPSFFTMNDEIDKFLGALKKINNSFN